MIKRSSESLKKMTILRHDQQIHSFLNLSAIKNAMCIKLAIYGLACVQVIHYVRSPINMFHSLLPAISSNLDNTNT